jgi:hypothetical protein
MTSKHEGTLLGTQGELRARVTQSRLKLEAAKEELARADRQYRACCFLAVGLLMLDGSSQTEAERSVTAWQ